jgi:3',5'-nucleoside bisphosphate phosphatase
MKNTDLHIHTYYSDGNYSPKEIINFALFKKLKAISITDHNNLTGAIEAQQYINKIKIIPGIEINSKETEILGYFIDFEDVKLNNTINKIQEVKEKITLEKIKQIQDFNIDIEIEEVLEKVPKNSIPMMSHVAMVLSDKLNIKFQDVFEKIIFKTKRVDTGEKEYTTKEIIKTIINAGGVAVLPHPWFLKERQFEDIDHFLQKLISYGLSGIETTGPIPEIFKKRLKTIKEKAKEYNLIDSGGSDFHGEKYLSENILGDYNISYNVIDKLKNKIK